MIELNKIYNEDCLEGMKRIPDKSVDMILCDLPYGTTACKWDTIIPFEPLWEQYERVIKDNGTIVLTASQPFTSALVMSNPSMFRYSLVWDKVATASGVLAKKQPLKSHEDVNVFYKKQPKYNPQMVEGKQWARGGKVRSTPKIYGEKKEIGLPTSDKTNMKYPKSVLTISNANRLGRLHPTQKPVALFEYLIRTYTNENETILDNCMGSGTTAIACINTNRNFIGFELDENYHTVANERIAKHLLERQGD